MNPDEQLQKFRNQWRNELSNESSENSARFNAAQACSKSENQHVNKKPSVTSYFPCMPSVKTLLDENNEAETNHCTFERKLISKPIDNLSKQSRERKCYKRQKLRNLQDIFVEKQHGEIPTERLLDKLISDIVGLS